MAACILAQAQAVGWQLLGTCGSKQQHGNITATSQCCLLKRYVINAEIISEDRQGA
jgi:hypothetical protein